VSGWLKKSTCLFIQNSCCGLDIGVKSALANPVLASTEQILAGEVPLLEKFEERLHVIGGDTLADRRSKVESPILQGVVIRVQRWSL
jgi:hypothetical protein